MYSGGKGQGTCPVVNASSGSAACAASASCGALPASLGQGLVNMQQKWQTECLTFYQRACLLFPLPWQAGLVVQAVMVVPLRQLRLAPDAVARPPLPNPRRRRVVPWLVCRERDLVAGRREPTQTPSCWLGRPGAPGSATLLRSKGGTLRPLLQTCLK
jgi:hypothetical protein